MMMMIMDIIQFLLLAAVTFTSPGMTQQQECEIGSFPHQQQFSLSDGNIDFLVPNSTASELIGYLVIVPQLKFDCHGYITRWHARTWLNSAELVIDNLNHDITFQLWRPNTADDRLYSFVGSNTFQFMGTSLRAGLSEDRHYFNLTGSPTDDERLFFQPGDVVGWYIHTTIRSTDRPLTIVYRYVTSSDLGLQTFDMYSRVITDTAYAATPPPCDVAICSSQNTLISSVIPYVTVEYETLSDPQQTGRLGPPLCIDNSSPSDDCPPKTTTPPLPPTTTTPPVHTPGDDDSGSQIFTEFTLPVIGVLAASGVIIFIAFVIFVILLVLCVRRRTCRFSTPAKSRQKSFPTYTSPVDLRNRRSTQKMHDVNDAHIMTINLEDNKAYRVIEKKDPIVSKENDTAATTISLADNEAYRVIERKDAIITRKNDAYAHIMTINLEDNEAYGVIEKQDAVDTRKNDAYEAAAILSIRETSADEQNMYEIIT